MILIIKIKNLDKTILRLIKMKNINKLTQKFKKNNTSLFNNKSYRTEFNVKSKSGARRDLIN